MVLIKLKVKELISEVIPLNEFEKIYGDIGNSKSIASIIKYDEHAIPENTVVILNESV